MLDKYGKIINVVAPEAETLDTIEKNTGIKIVLEKIEDFTEEFLRNLEYNITGFDPFVNQFGGVIFSALEDHNCAIIKDEHVVIFRLWDIDTVPDSIIIFTGLKCLEIFRCKDANIDKWVGVLHALVSLDISHTHAIQ
jgi:hypothetical protein